MGKKYIIELLDDCPSEFKGIMVFGLTQEKQISVELIPEESLTPYTEPDLPRTCAYKLGYENGLNDLWEAMQKAIKMYCEIDNEVFLRVFYDVKCDWGESVLQALFKNTPQHLIDSIREYEESKEKHTWICSEVNEPSVDTTLICSECGYAIKIKPHETPELNFCPKCGDCKKPKEEKI